MTSCLRETGRHRLRKPAHISHVYEQRSVTLVSGELREIGYARALSHVGSHAM